MNYQDNTFTNNNLHGSEVSNNKRYQSTSQISKPKLQDMNDSVLVNANENMMTNYDSTLTAGEQIKPYANRNMQQYTNWQNFNLATAMYNQHHYDPNQNFIPQLYTQPFQGRRRVSISNGQISQLGLDIETLEDVTNSQPPPMPYFPSQMNISQKQDIAYNQNTNILKRNLGNEKNVPLVLDPHNASYTRFQSMYNNNIVDNMNSEYDALSDSMSQSNLEIPLIYNDIQNKYYPNTVSNSMSSSPQPSTSRKSSIQLERNRVAASKSRKKKKIQQLQLQAKYDKVSKNNKIMRRKINYYERLTKSFQKVFKNHIETCTSDRDSLAMIHDILCQDIKDIHENINEFENGSDEDNDSNNEDDNLKP